jgi:cobyrinic acid a,c-diamide synthase
MKVTLRSSEPSCFVVAAAHTGAGKTTVAAGLIAALRRRGLDVRPFKVGPDYVDPGFLTRAAGHPARNLDGWLLDAPTLRWLFARRAAGGATAVAVIEGMMGLFDGLTGGDDTGSTAHVARVLDLPVVIVLDASRASRSVAAVARGCQVFDRRVRIAGWILNRVAGETHRRWVTEAVERATRRPVLGWLPEDQRLSVPERHLGLIQAQEANALGRLLARLAHEVEQRFDLARLLSSTRGRRTDPDAEMPPRLAQLLSCDRASRIGRPDRCGSGESQRALRSHPVIAWARDEAFTFHYADNIELLEALGARIVPWSPLVDSRLPERTAAVVMGGGYPELYAPALAENRPALDAVRAFARRGGPLYAECGGLMYLSRGIDTAGRRHRLGGIVPAWARMMGRARVAYVRAVSLRDTILAPRGTIVRGHEFHTSFLRPVPASEEAAYRVEDAGASAAAAPSRLDGYCRASVLASYVHLNFLADPRLAARLVASACSTPPPPQRAVADVPPVRRRR